MTGINCTKKFSQKVIIWAYILVAAVLRAKTAGNDAKPHKSEHLIKMPCMCV